MMIEAQELTVGDRVVFPSETLKVRRAQVGVDKVWVSYWTDATQTNTRSYTYPFTAKIEIE